MKTILLSLSLVFSFTITAFANDAVQPEPVEIHFASFSNWDKLGEKRVNFRLERDVIKAGLEGLFSTVKLKVTGNRAVEFHRVVIKFRNGGQMTANLGVTVAPGSYSPAIQLKGNQRRIIKEIIFYYERNAGAGGAKVQAWGRHL